MPPQIPLTLVASVNEELESLFAFLIALTKEDRPYFNKLVPLIRNDMITCAEAGHFLEIEYILYVHLLAQQKHISLLQNEIIQQT
jgi:hypothetical protein